MKFAAGQMLVQDPIMPLDLAPVAVHGVGQLFRRRVLEMHRLTGERTDAGGDEEQPRQEIRADRRENR